MKNGREIDNKTNTLSKIPPSKHVKFFQNGPADGKQDKFIIYLKMSSFLLRHHKSMDLAFVDVHEASDRRRLLFPKDTPSSGPCK